MVLVRSEALFNRLKEKRSFRIIIYFFLALSIIYSLFNINRVNRRDRTLLSDMDQLSEFLEPGTTMGCATQKNALSLYAYFMRYHSISLDTLNPYHPQNVIIDVGVPFDSVCYTQENITTKQITLLQKKGQKEFAFPINTLEKNR